MIDRLEHTGTWLCDTVGAKMTIALCYLAMWLVSTALATVTSMSLFWFINYFFYGVNHA